MADSIYDGLIGRPFAEDGRGPDAWNCGWLSREVLRRKFGAAIGIAAEALRPTGDPQPLLDLGADPKFEEVKPPYKEFDLIVFRTTKHNAGVHCGTYVPGNRVLHADREVGVVCESLRRMKKFILGAYRYRATSNADT